MVFFFLRHFGHCVYEINRIGKIIELKRAFDVLLLQFPFRDFFHSLFELALFDEVSHNGTMSNTRKSFCNAKTSGCFCGGHPEGIAAEKNRPVALPKGESAGFFDYASLRSAPGQNDSYMPRIFLRFFAESKTSTAHARA